MAISEESRHAMHERLVAVLGRAEATTLMEHLPPVGWADVATQRDLDHLGSQLRSEIVATRTDMDHLGSQLRAEMAVMGSEIRTEIAGVRIEMADLRTELKAEMAELRGDLSHELGMRMVAQTRWLVSVMVALFGAGFGGLAAMIAVSH